MIKKIAILFAILGALNAYCYTGCLKCTSSNTCLYCDTTQSYVLLNGLCVLSPVANCLQMNESGGCINCAQGYYIDPILYTCVLLSPSLTVQNCAIHVGPGICTYCSTGYVLKNGSCQQLNSSIQNCLYQNGNGLCLSCNSGYMRNADQNLCIAVPTISNCATYSNIQCSQCANGYIYNPNNYLSIIYGFSNTSQVTKLTTFIYDLIGKIPDNSLFKVCQHITVTNCVTFIGSQTCAVCASGYYVNFQGQCVANPLPSIPNCTQYTSVAVCINCNQGYYLLNSSSCAPVNPITACLLYQTNVSYSSCTQCIDQYYLSSNNICTQRTSLSTILFCASLSSTSESCVACVAGYALTSDNLKCLQIITNCSTYIPSTFNNLSLQCSVCTQGYYLNSNYQICVIGTVNNCQTYNATSNTCAVCLPNFYLVSNACLPHNQLPYCLNYSSNTANTCAQCQPFTFLFTPVNNCVAAQPIANCITYASKTTCATCQDGYYLINPSNCIVIPPQYNCIQMQPNLVCTKCLLNYVLDSGSCYTPPQYIMASCANSNLNGLIGSTALQCNYCNPNYIPVNYINNFVCQDQNYLARSYLQPQQQFDNNCLQFKVNPGTNTLLCVRCNNNFVIQGNTCVVSCTDIANMTLYLQYIITFDTIGNTIQNSIQVVQTNVCGPTISNCAIAVPNLNTNFSTASYTCVKCMPGYFKVITMGGPMAITYNPGERIEFFYSEYGTSPIGIGPGVQCLTTGSSVLVVGETSQNTFVTGCDYFQQIFTNMYGCNKCLWGQTGVVVNLIKYCNTFSDTQTCTQCSAGYFLQTPKQCSQVINILNCTTYDATQNSTICTQCSSNYYLSSNACVVRVNSLNVAYSTSTVNADTVLCSVGYVLDNGTVPYTCLQYARNCVTGTVANHVITCTACNNVISYLSGGLCLDGGIANCAQYSASANTCAQCSNGYYLVGNNQCSAHSTSNDTNCSIWDQNTKNLCNTCNINAVRFSISSICLAVNIQVANCATYANINQCKTCNAGFYLDNLGKTCRLISASLNCATYVPVDINSDGVFDSNDLVTGEIFLYTCTLCSTGYYQHAVSVTTNLFITPATVVTKTVNVCYNYLNFARQQCAVSGVTGSVDLGGGYCNACNTGYFPYNFTNKYICVESAYIAYKSNTFDVNCTVITYSAPNTFKCLRCSYGYFINVDNSGNPTSTCASISATTCNNTFTVANNNTVPFLYYFTATGNSLTFQTGACKANAQNVSQATGATFQSGYNLATGNLTTLVSSCLSTKLPVLSFTPTDYSYMLLDPNNTSYTMYSPFDGFEAIKSCVTQTSTNVYGYISSTGFINNCQYYLQLDTNLYGCMKCQFGYNGRINNYTSGSQLNYGFIEYCQVLSGCNTNVNSGTFNTQLAAQTNGLLNRYFSCYACSPDGSNNARVVIAAVGAGATPATPGTTFNAVYGLRAYGVPIGIAATFSAAFGTLTTSYSNFCTQSSAAALATNLGISGVSAMVITNCSAYYLNVDADATDANGGLVCAACLPGYYPTYDAVNTFQVDSCTLITNCTVATAGNSLNACMTCIQTFNPYNDIVNYATCINIGAGVVSSTSCFAAIDNNNCSLCRPGYELDTTVNGQATCFQLTVPTCSQVNFYNDFGTNYALALSVINTSLYLYQGISSSVALTGCTACTSPTNVLLLNNSSNNSDLDTYACTGGSDNRRTASVANCSQIGWSYANSAYICMTCANGYILTSNNQCTAVDAVRLPFCSIASQVGGDTCAQCTAARYILIGGVCLDSQAGILPVGLIANCATYTAGSATLPMGVCATCAAGFYLLNLACSAIPDSHCQTYDAAQGCLVCNNKYVLFMLSGKNVCINLDPTNTGNYSFDQNCAQLYITTLNASNQNIQTKNLACSTCSANYYLSTTASNFNMISQCVNIATQVDANCLTYDIQPTIAASTYKCTSCNNYNTHYLNQFNNLCTARTNIPNCLTYDSISNTCLVCQANYALNFGGTICNSLTAYVNNKPVNGGYIHACRAMSTCNTEVYYDGLNADLNSFYSCHVCSDTTQIPFVAVRSDANENFIQSLNEFGFNASNAVALNQGTGGSAVTCLKPIFSNFNIASSANFAFPSNCALGMIKVDLVPNATQSATASITMNQASVICTACQPGYKATGATLTANGSIVAYMVSSCAVITNCNYSTWFNACTQCASGYSYSYSPTNGISYDSCVSYPSNPQCYAVYVNGGTSSCAICNRGTYLNNDGICDLINPPNCQNNSYKFNYPIVSNIISTGLFMVDSGAGCNKCTNGFAAIYSTTSTFVCTQSLYLVKTSLSANTSYIQNCINYTSNPLGVLLCAICNTNYIPTTNGQCVSTSNIPFCAIAISLSSCSQCSTGYVLVNRKCQMPAITNCATYYSNTLSYQQVCNQCAAGYYLSGNQCLAGSVQNCQVMENNTVCSQCASGYTLTMGSNNVSFCYPNSSTMNCLTFDPVQFQSGILSCTSCINGNYVISTSQTDFTPTFCMPFTNLITCAVFTNKNTIASSSFQCQQCQQNYYLANGNCMQRTILPFQCTQYSITSDACISCSTGYYVDLQGATCTAYPAGIPGCISYKSRSVCNGCDANYFLQDNSCIAIVSQIPSCIYYADPQTCSTCANGYVLIQGQCITAYAQNCLTYASLTVCKTCSSGFGLGQVGSLTNCIQKNIPNCVTSTNDQPFSCLICATGYYPNTGLCAAVTATITNCVVYNTATTCAQCSNGTALSVDQLSCDNSPYVFSQLDPNCLNPSIVQTPICNSCQPGYYFQYGLCQPCTIQTLANGCYSCDSNNPSQCLICSSGYYMAAEGNCISNSSLTIAPSRLVASYTLSKVVTN